MWAQGALSLPRRTRLRSSAALVALLLTLTIAACGSSGHKPTAAANAAYAYANCMRAHDVPNFPDPTPSSSGGGFSVVGSPGSSAVVINGTSFSGPAFNAASKACGRSGAGISPPPLTEAQKQGMFAKARCLRRHGVPGFPDPSFGPGGHGVDIPLGPGFNPDSPAMQRAAKACAGVGVSLPHTPT